MIEAIDKKYCIDNLIQLMPYTDEFHLITSANEIILLKTRAGILINKYSNHPSRYLFPFSDKEQCDQSHFTELFEYNKLYLNLRFSFKNYRIDKSYFFKGNNKALLFEESLPTNEKYNIEQLSRSEINEIFNSDNYDAMYIIDSTGNLLLAKNEKENLNINRFKIPDDEEIIKMELQLRQSDLINAYAISHTTYLSSDDYKVYKKKVIETVIEKQIEDIENFGICGDTFLLTVKNDNFDLKQFRIDFNKNKFKLSTKPIKIVEPTIDNVISYYKNNNITYTLDPKQPASKKIKIKSL